MSLKAPRPDNLSASREWVKWKFGVKGQYRGALRQVERSLNTIESYEYSFLLAKASLLACLERWSELSDLLKRLLNRDPANPELLDELAELFMAHGDWRACLAVVDKAHRVVRTSSDRQLLDSLYDTKLTSLYALGHKRRAVREGHRILRAHPRLSGVRSVLRHIEAGKLKVDPWAPRSAGYLKELRRLAT